MCNVTIAKNKLKSLKLRTEKDLYVLKFGSINYLPLNEDTLKKVKTICNENDLPCPIYKYGNTVKFKKKEDYLFSVLHTLAEEHNIILDYSTIL